MRNTSKENEQLVKTGKLIGGTQRIKKMMAGETDEDGKRDQKQRQEANEEKKISLATVITNRKQEVAITEEQEAHKCALKALCSPGGHTHAYLIKPPLSFQHDLLGQVRSE